MKTTTIRILVSIILIVASVAMLWQDKYLNLLKKLTFADFAICILFTLGLFIINGMTIGYLTWKRFKKKISLIDVFTLPYMLNLWGFIVPFRGGMLFTIYFLKTKYAVLFVQGFSMMVFMYMVSFFIMGVFGCGYMISLNQIFSLGMLVSIVLLFNPLIIKYTNNFLQKVQIAPSSKLFNKLKGLFHTVIDSSHLFWKDIRIILFVVMLVFFRLTLISCRYYGATRAFNIQVPFVDLFILSLSIEFSDIIFRFSPGNLGLSEVVTGGIFSVLGQETESGLLIALFVRFVNLLLIFSIGTIAVIFNMKYFHTKGLKDLWVKIKTT